MADFMTAQHQGKFPQPPASIAAENTTPQWGVCGVIFWTFIAQ
jgi:hypothetical protein